MFFFFFYTHVTCGAVAEVTRQGHSPVSFHDSVCVWSGLASAQVRPSANEEAVWRVNPGSGGGYCIVGNEAGRILPRHLCNQLKMFHPPSNHFTLINVHLFTFYFVFLFLTKLSMIFKFFQNLEFSKNLVPNSHLHLVWGFLTCLRADSHIRRKGQTEQRICRCRHTVASAPLRPDTIIWCEWQLRRQSARRTQTGSSRCHPPSPPQRNLSKQPLPSKQVSHTYG